MFLGVARKPNYSNSTLMTHPGRQKKKPELHLKNCRPKLPQLIWDFMIQQLENRQGKNGIPGSHFIEKNTKVHLTYEKFWLLPGLLGWYTVNWWEKSPVTSGIKETQRFIKQTYTKVNHGGGVVMIWGCIAASGSGWLAIIDVTMNSELYLSNIKICMVIWDIYLGQICKKKLGIRKGVKYFFTALHILNGSAPTENVWHREKKNNDKRDPIPLISWNPTEVG